MNLGERRRSFVRLLLEMYGTKFDPVFVGSGVLLLTIGVYGFKVVLFPVLAEYYTSVHHGMEVSLFWTLLNFSPLLAIFLAAAALGVLALVREHQLWRER